MHFSIDRTVHTTAFDKPVVDHWLERKMYMISEHALQIVFNAAFKMQTQKKKPINYLHCLFNITKKEETTSNKITNTRVWVINL